MKMKKKKSIQIEKKEKYVIFRQNEFIVIIW